jgi:hypothetical protein
MRRKGRTKAPAKPRTKTAARRHPHGVAAPGFAPDIDDASDRPFAAGVADALDADLRHRLVSEAAFHHQMERGYNSDYEDDDWRDAESEIEQVTLGFGTRS